MRLGRAVGVVGELERTMSEIVVVRACGFHIRGSCCCYCYGTGTLIGATIAGGGSASAGAGVTSAGRFEQRQEVRKVQEFDFKEGIDAALKKGHSESDIYLNSHSYCNSSELFLSAPIDKIWQTTLSFNNTSV
jgi:hypothetical protein